MISFHIQEYAQHFAAACQYLLVDVEVDNPNLSWQGRTVRLTALPMGIDAQEWHERARSEEGEKKLEELRKKYKGRKVVFSLDRLDYTKGMPQRFEAIAAFLERYPGWRDKVVFVQIAVPSRGFEQYQVIQSQVEQLAGNIGGRFGSALDYQYRRVDPVELAAHYRLADVILSTSIKDGLCLIPKEAMATRDDGDAVVCIVSPFAGVSKELEEAFIVNPWDTLGMVRCLHRALNMPKRESGSMTTALRRRVNGNTTEGWALKTFSQLDEVCMMNR